METFKIEIKETLSKIVVIEADSVNEAYSKAKEMYRCEEIVLDENDHLDTVFIELEEE